MRLCRYSGRWSQYLLTITWASNPAPATPRLTGRMGAAAWKMVWHFVHASFARTVRMTLKRAGTYSQVLRDVRTDAPQVAAATRAAAVLAQGVLVSGRGVRAELLLLAWQVSRQATIEGAGVGGRPRRTRGRQFMQRRRLQQAGLAVVESFAGGAVLCVQPARELQGELVDHQLQRRHFGHALA